MSACPRLTQSEKNRTILKDDGSGVRTVGDVVKKMRAGLAARGGSACTRRRRRRRVGGGKGMAACILVLAGILTLGTTYASYAVAAKAFQEAGVTRKQLDGAYDTVTALHENHCGTPARMAATAAAKDANLMLNDCEDYARAIGGLVESTGKLVRDAPTYLRFAQQGWTTAVAAATLICGACMGRSGGGRRRRTRRRKIGRRRRRRRRRRR